MGFKTRKHAGGEIKSFTPDDTEDIFHVQSSITLGDLIDRITSKWPDADFAKIEIEATYVHTDCIGYDLYDSSDYSNYLMITKKS
jgi:hypothetical protein